MSLGENIYKLRTDRRMSQEDFASAMEVSRQSVSKWENDMAVPELEKLIKMAKLFEVSLDELVGNTPPLPEPEPVDAPPPGITTGDLISVVLLILGIVLPVLVLSLYLNFYKDNLVVYLIGWCLFPPLVTLGASYCSPNSKLLYRVYLIYNILFSFVELPATAPFGFILCLVNFAAVCHWSSRLED